MKKNEHELLNSLTSQSQAAERLRKRQNFHDSYGDPFQRMLVAIEPGSYVRPHRHLATPKHEAFLVLQERLEVPINGRLNIKTG